MNLGEPGGPVRTGRVRIPPLSTNRKAKMDQPWYAEVSCGHVLAVVETVKRKRYWFDHLDDTTKVDALSLPKWDINRRRFIKSKVRPASK